MEPATNSTNLGPAARRTVDLRFVELIDKVRKNRPGDDFVLLRRAYEFAAEHHKGQIRLSGEPYLSHPLEVAHSLADMKLDSVSLCAALLHDVVEDTKVTLEKLSAEFGPDVARLVEGVTKISRLDLLAPEARQAENVRKMLLAMVNDVRVVLVKLADRLHNMRTLQYLDPEKQQRIARETLDIYAPVANRLGMGLIRGELEDLSFRFLESEAFLELQKKVATKQKVFDKFLFEVQDSIRGKMVESGIPAEVQARTKRLYSLHLKIQKQQRTLDQVYDLLAVRVVTDTVKNCYAALGVIHQIWRPVPGRFKDYIAMPRPNLYQSLHTTVIHAGQPFEVQIRTQEMHRIAEQGVAAHWKYKDGRAETASSPDDQRIIWMRHLIEWVQEMQEPSEFLSTLRVDLYPEEVYTFTPKGRVVVLPRGATPIDFAYAVHTEVGHQCTGAKVNGEMVPLRHALANGDVVEIVIQKGHNPSRDWLACVHTSRARSKIRQWIHLHERQEATEVGRRLLEKEARNLGVSLKKIPSEDLQRVASEYGCSRVEDLYADLGYGKWSARQVIAKATGKTLPEAAEDEKHPKAASTVKRMLGIDDSAILVRGHGDLMVYRSKCCNPIPGDDIVGYVTRGRGIAVHSKLCPNVENLLYEAERRIPVEWAGSTQATFPVRLRIFTEDRPGMLAGITAVISETGANIRTFESGGEDNTRARIEVALDVRDRKQLELILAGIKRIPGVFDIERVYNV
jgi:GTP diphosphokinase / guanosine-3',5'-bis(diphosphate) 3'-diphosphatase